METIFITGIGTGVGKTIVSAIVAQALEADYWKPVQAGFDDGTDTQSVKRLIANNSSNMHPEVYRLRLAASPHIAARAENTIIDLNEIVAAHEKISAESANTTLVTEGAGGLMVPLNDDQFVADLVKRLQAKVILVSRNYLGSINHSLLTAAFCQQHRIDVLGWIFNDQYMDYEEEIVKWSGYKRLGSVPFTKVADKNFIADEAKKMRPSLLAVL